MIRRQATYAVALALCSFAGVGAQPGPTKRSVITPSDDAQRFLSAALTATIRALPSDSAPVCLVLRGGPPAFAYSPPEVLLAALRTDSRRIVASPDCPPTYDLMSVLRDSSGRDVTPERPAGYIDPHLLVVDEYRLVGADSASMRAVAHQGTVNRHFRCTARRGVDRIWRTSCQFLGQTMSALPPNESLQLTGDSNEEVVVAARLVPRVGAVHLAG